VNHVEWTPEILSGGCRTLTLDEFLKHCRLSGVAVEV
jgi:hypothetical protein